MAKRLDTAALISLVGEEKLQKILMLTRITIWKYNVMKMVPIS